MHPGRACPYERGRHCLEYLYIRGVHARAVATYDDVVNSLDAVLIYTHVYIYHEQ